MRHHIGATGILRMERYAQQRAVAAVPSLRRLIERKAAWIARHDKKLNARQPQRNISIPT